MKLVVYNVSTIWNEAIDPYTLLELITLFEQQPPQLSWKNGMAPMTKIAPIVMKVFGAS